MKSIIKIISLALITLSQVSSAENLNTVIGGTWIGSGKTVIGNLSYASNITCTYLEEILYCDWDAYEGTQLYIHLEPTVTGTYTFDINFLENNGINLNAGSGYCFPTVCSMNFGSADPFVEVFNFKRLDENNLQFTGQVFDYQGGTMVIWDLNLVKQ